MKCDDYIFKANPLEVTKLIYCSRTVPELEKVSTCNFV
jgi:hypothetical protein